MYFIKPVVNLLNWLEYYIFEYFNYSVILSILSVKLKKISSLMDFISEYVLNLWISLNHISKKIIKKQINLFISKKIKPLMANNSAKQDFHSEHAHKAAFVTFRA